jgi:hypothetical protein
LARFLAIRLLRTFLPAVVAFRAKKPWVLARFFFFGLYVNDIALILY